MKKTIIIIFNLLFVLSSYAQQIELKGVVSIQNSEYNTGTRQYVEGASISADFTKDKITDSEGNFTLEFVGESFGSSTQIEVYKSDLETVNLKDLEEVIIGRSPYLKIYMCKKGELAVNKVRYYKVSLENLYVERDRRIAFLEKGGEAAEAEIKRLEKELNIEIHGKNDAIHKLNQEIEKQKTKLPEFAKNLALVNLDDASELYKKAYELYLEGKIKEAIDLIDKDQLLKEGLKVIDDLRDVEEKRELVEETQGLFKEERDQRINTLAFKAELLEQQFNYQEAAKSYETIITILKSDSLGVKREISEFQNKTALQFQKLGKYQEALEYFQLALEIDEQIFENADSILAEDYNNLASIYQVLGDLQKALNAQEKALEISEQVFDKNHQRIAIYSTNLASIYQDLGNPKKALVVQLRALEIDKQIFDEIHPKIAEDYNRLSSIYRELGKLKKTLKHQKDALQINEEVFGENHPQIAIDYCNLFLIYKELKDSEQALMAQEKALKINHQVFDKINSQMVIDYNDLAMVYKYLGEPEQALIAQNQILQINEQIFNEVHPKIATNHRNLSMIHKDLGDLEQALMSQKKALEIDSQIFGEIHPTIAKDYNNLVILYKDLGDINELSKAQEKLHFIQEILKKNRSK